MAFIPSGQLISSDPFDTIETYPDSQPYGNGGETKEYANNKPFVDTVAPVAREVITHAARVGAQHIKDRLDNTLNNKDRNKDGKGPNKPGSNNKDGSNGGNGGRSRRPRGGSDDDSQNSSPGGGGGFTTSGQGSRNGQNRIQWNSGIRTGLVVNPRLIRADNSPIFLSSGWLFVNTDSDINSFETHFESNLRNIIWPTLNSIISETINRWSGQFITPQDFVVWVYDLVKALQVYYCLDSLLAYTSNNSMENINPGMESLKSNITADCIVEFQILRATLENTACPPNLLAYIRFMCQNFRTSSVPHSSIIKLNIGGMFDCNWEGSASSKILSLIRESKRNIDSNGKLISFIQRTYPNWLIGKMPLSSNTASFDINFFTFWHNMNCCYIAKNDDKHFTYTHNVKGIDDYLDYQIHEKDEKVDGTIFATASTFIKDEDNVTTATYYGIWLPLASTAGKVIPPGDQRETFSVKHVDSLGVIRHITNDVMLGRTGIHWLTSYEGNIGSWVAKRVQLGTHGFVDLQNVSPRMQSEPFNNTMRLWFNLSIKGK